jgi:TonB family protein
MNRFLKHGTSVAILAAASVARLAAQDHTMGEAGLTAPRVIHKTEPQYTEEARAAKVSGTVGLKIVVDEAGNPDSVEVTKSLDQGLDQKAVEAVHQWKFAPGTKDGKAVRVIAAVEVNFRLQ